MPARQDWNQMREGIIGLGAESSRRSYYPELLARVAELEQAQEGLRRSEANLQTLFNSLPDGVIIHDREGRVLEVNDAMLAMYGVSETSFRTFSILDYSAPLADPGALAARIIDLLNHPERRENFGKMARQVIMEKNDLYREMGKMEALYQQLIEKRG